MEIKNTIIKSPHKFRLICSNFQILGYRDVQKGSSLIILKELDLTKNNYHHGENLSALAWATAVGQASVGVFAYLIGVEQLPYYKTYYQAKKEFINTGKIQGFEVLNLVSMDKLWISNYDLRFLENANS